MSQTFLNGKVEYVDIKLKAEWMGNPKGCVMTINKRQADILCKRGSAKILEESDSKKNLLKTIRRKRDKMIRSDNEKIVVK